MNQDGPRSASASSGCLEAWCSVAQPQLLRHLSVLRSTPCPDRISRAFRASSASSRYPVVHMLSGEHLFQLLLVLIVDDGRTVRSPGACPGTPRISPARSRNGPCLSVVLSRTWLPSPWMWKYSFSVATGFPIRQSELTTILRAEVLAQLAQPLDRSGVPVVPDRAKVVFVVFEVCVVLEFVGELSFQLRPDRIGTASGFPRVGARRRCPRRSPCALPFLPSGSFRVRPSAPPAWPCARSCSV